jgi:hypothetical protein
MSPGDLAGSSASSSLWRNIGFQVIVVLDPSPSGLFSDSEAAEHERFDFTMSNKERKADILRIRQDEIQIEKHFGVDKLSEHADLWNEFTDVLFRGHGQMEEEVGGETGSLKDRYTVWWRLATIPSLSAVASNRSLAQKYTRWRNYVDLVDRLMRVLLKNTQMFITRTGCIGTVVQNGNLQVDDEIWVLFGGSTPYILRKCEEYHRLMAPCYLHGFMDGEAIAGWRVGKYKVQAVTLV